MAVSRKRRIDAAIHLDMAAGHLNRAAASLERARATRVFDDDPGALAALDLLRAVVRTLATHAKPTGSHDPES